MKCLFVFPNAPLSENYTGAATRYLNHFQALHRLGIDVHVWRPLAEDQLDRVYAFEHVESANEVSIREQVLNWQDVTYQRRDNVHEVAATNGYFSRNLKTLYSAYTQPIEFFFHDITPLKSQFQAALNRIQPDFIWANWTFSGVLVMSTNEDRIPWIYAHHDWLHKIYSIRTSAANWRAYLSFNLLNTLRRKVEEEVVNSSTAVITGSATEGEEIRRAGQPNVFTIPTTYQSISVNLDQPAPAPVRFIHLGALQATANYVGLKAYLQKVHPVVWQKLEEKGISAEFWVIGDTRRIKPDLEALLRANRIILKGFVAELSDVLRPFDIAIIPYTENSGTRTKLPLLFNYGQVVVATENAVKGTPEVLSHDCCVVLKRIEDFAQVLVDLAEDAERRKTVGTAAKHFFERHFTLSAQMHSFQSAIDTITD